MKKIKLKGNKEYMLTIALDGVDLVKGVAKLESVGYTKDFAIVTIRLISDKTLDNGLK